MKRIVALAIVGVLILGLLVPTITFAQGSPGGNPPSQGNPQEQTILLTIIEDHTLAPYDTEGDTYWSEWIDVKSYRVFKLYALQGGQSPVVDICIHDSALGAPDDVVYAGLTPEWGGFPQEWTIAYEFSGLFSKVRVRARNESSETSANITAHLLMAKE